MDGLAAPIDTDYNDVNSTFGVITVDNDLSVGSDDSVC